MSKKKLAEGRQRIEDRRREVERRLAAVKSAVQEETGHALHGRGLLTAMIAGTVGLALALRGRARRQGRLAAGDG